MLLSITRPTIGLAATSNPVIEALVNLMPDYSAGRRLHGLYVNKLQSALPGNYSKMFGTGPSFRSVFFPAWQPDPYLSMLGDTGLDDGWWRNFSVAVLCQAIQELGSSIRGQMLTGKINADVAAFNGTLRGQSSRVYAGILAATYDPLASLLRQVDPATAKQQFHDSLLNNVLTRQLWYQAGMWTSPDWEMFNQYAKYIALGASDTDVDNLIGELKAAGLPIPPQVDRGTWRSYAEELSNAPNVDLNDIRNATAGPIGVTTYIQTFDGPPASIPNGNCYEFTANSQPGSSYRERAGGCCFTGDTEVLDGSGNPVPLRQIKAGDTVLTRDGTATVAFVPRPLRASRSLHQLVGGGPVFTRTHPFLNAAAADPSASVPAVLALDPRQLAWTVPTLSENGIGRLGPGSIVLSRESRSGPSPMALTVVGVEEVTVNGDEPYLYDLNLVANSGTRQEFWAGQGDRFYLVSPELPVFGEAEAATTTVVAIMEGVLAAFGAAHSGWPSGVIDTINQFGIGVFYGALMEALGRVPSFGTVTPSGSLYDRIARLYAGLDTATPETAAVVASLFDGLMSAVGQWLTSVVGLGWRNGLELGGDVLTVTVFDMALTSSPITAATSIRLDVTVTNQTASKSTTMYDRRGRTNTRFHHYFDQLVHLDMTQEDGPAGLSFAAFVNSAPIPVLFADVPLAGTDSLHQLRSAVLRDSTGKEIGAIRFDMRRLSHEVAAQELAQLGLWTDAAASGYADALGAAMVEPIVNRLRQLAPR